MNWKRTKTLFIFVFILVNILLVMIYIKLKSQINDSEKWQQVNFQQEEIKVPTDVLNKKDTELAPTARSKDFSSYAKEHSSLIHLTKTRH